MGMLLGNDPARAKETRNRILSLSSWEAKDAKSLSCLARAGRIPQTPPSSWLLHEPSVADDDRLTGQCVRTEAGKEERSFRHVFHGGEFPVHGFFQHDVLDHILF